MEHAFWGSPASLLLVALIFELIYLAAYLTCRANLLASAGGFVICDVFICISLYAYAESLHSNAQYPLRVAYQCVAQAFVSGLLLAVPLSLAIFQAWEPWGYFLLVWAITLMVDFVFDFLVLGLWWFDLPVWRFTTRSSKPSDRKALGPRSIVVARPSS